MDVAENETAVSDPELALSTLAPTTGPRIQEPTVATPASFVTVLAPVTDPPPDPTENVTVTPDATLPLASFTRTDGGTETALPAVAV